MGSCRPFSAAMRHVFFLKLVVFRLFFLRVIHIKTYPKMFMRFKQ